MKKLQILLLLFTMVGGLSGHLKCQAETSSKIIFEDNLNVRDLSNEEGQKEGYTSNIVCVQLHLDYETKTERLDVDKDASLKEIKEAKASRLARMKDYYYNKNKDISSNIEINGNESMYISKYTPYIEYEFTYEAYKTLEYEIINEINDCQYIDTAYIGYNEKKIKDDMIYKNEIFAKWDGKYVNELDPHKRAVYYTIPQIKVEDRGAQSANGSDIREYTFDFSFSSGKVGAEEKVEPKKETEPMKLVEVEDVLAGVYDTDYSSLFTDVDMFLKNALEK